jgi:hypothetical protein
MQRVSSRSPLSLWRAGHFAVVAGQRCVVVGADGDLLIVRMDDGSEHEVHQSEAEPDQTPRRECRLTVDVARAVRTEDLCDWAELMDHVFPDVMAEWVRQTARYLSSDRARSIRDTAQSRWSGLSQQWLNRATPELLRLVPDPAAIAEALPIVLEELERRRDECPTP